MNKPGLRFTLISATKDFFGVWEISIQIGYVEYTYSLDSSYAVEQFNKLLQKKRYGAALNLLKQWKLSIKKKELPRPSEVSEQEKVLSSTKKFLVQGIRILGKNYILPRDKIELLEVELTKALDTLITGTRKEKVDASN